MYFWTKVRQRPFLRFILVFLADPDSCIVSIDECVEGQKKLFTLEFWGPWNAGAKSAKAPGAFETEWGHWRCVKTILFPFISTM
jgi:hypothetical protein